jgi:type II secretion system protein N
MNVNWLDERKEILGWILGGACVMALCLLATFPYGALHERLIAELNGATGMDVRVTDWTAGFPLGLEWRNVTLANPEWEPIQLAFMQAKVRILKALGGGVWLDVLVRQDDVSPNNGLAEATVTASSYSFAGPVTVKGQFQQVDLSKVVRRYVSRGILTGDFSHRVDQAQETAGTIKGEGTWKAEARDLAIEHIPVGNDQTLSLGFTNVSARLLCRDIHCDVTELKGDGIDGSFTGEGRITVHQPMRNSQVALTVMVVPGAGFIAKASTLGLPPLAPGTPMTVKIVGTLAQARIGL